MWFIVGYGKHHNCMNINPLVTNKLMVCWSPANLFGLFLKQLGNFCQCIVSFLMVFTTSVIFHIDLLPYNDCLFSTLDTDDLVLQHHLLSFELAMATFFGIIIGVVLWLLIKRVKYVYVAFTYRWVYYTKTYVACACCLEGKTNNCCEKLHFWFDKYVNLQCSLQIHHFATDQYHGLQSDWDQ